MGGGDRRDFPVPLAFLPLYYPPLPRGMKVGLFPLACNSLRFFVMASIRRMRGNLIRDRFVAESTLRQRKGSKQLLQLSRYYCKTIPLPQGASLINHFNCFCIIRCLKHTDRGFAGSCRSIYVNNIDACISNLFSDLL